MPNSSSIPARQYVDLSTIPLSDLTDEELADPNVPQKLKSIPGLAYAIPVKDTGQDTEDTPGDAGPQAQALFFDRHTWSGTIAGRVLTSQWNGRSKTTKAAFPLAVSGIRVELMGKDGLWDDFLASAHTDDDGRFSITFSTTQGSEGSYLELYVNVVATTAGGTIRVIKRIGITRSGTCGRSNPTDLSYNTHALNLGDVSPDHDDVKPHLVHYGFQNRGFLGQNGLGNILPNSQSKPLKMMISPLNAKQNRALFIPGGYRNPVAGALIATFGQLGFIGLGIGAISAAGLTFYLSNDDCLYIGENEETEETVYHEFGHYLMWHMQNKSWANVLEASFASHSYQTNASNPKIAWTEGWADGFSQIMDAYTVRYDGERDVDDSGISGNEVRTTLENNKSPTKRNGVFANEYTLTKGYLSEYFIATTLYDLWDSSNNLTLRPNSPSNATSTGAGSPTGASNPALAFNDDNPSNVFRPSISPQGILDESGLSFADLVAPIRAHPGNGIWGIGQFSSTVVQNMSEYFRYLLQLHGDCEERRQLANVFLLNRISDFPNQAGLSPDAPTQRMGTDEIQRAVTMTEPLFTYDSGDQAYYANGTTTLTVTLDKNELAGVVDSYNLAAGAASLSDPLTVRDGAALGLNSGTERGYSGSGQYAPGSGSYAAELCGRLRLTVARDGRLELGSAQGNTATAALGNSGLIEGQNGGTLRVDAGSVLTIRRGATLAVRNGSTLVVNGQVRVESGGFICVEPGANLVFSPVAELYIDPAATLGTNPALNLPAGAGCSGQLAVCGRLTGGNAGVTNIGGRNEALQFDGNDVVSIPSTNSYANSLGQQFAVEAFLRADNLSISGAQTIFSSRHTSSVNSNGLNGILFSLYGGQLLLQLNGVNYYSSANQLPNDNGCHQVAVTRDNTNRVRFYIDGRETAYAPSATASAYSDGSLNIGGDNVYGSYGENFRGMVGKVRVWNSWRSAEQIRQNSTAKLPAPQYGLVAYYDMQDTTGSQQLSDLSGVNYSGQALMPGVLGATSSAGSDDPTWVAQCALACTVQGNFLAGPRPLSWTAADSAAMPLPKHAKGKEKDKNKSIAALSVSPNPTAGAATLHFEHLQADRVRVWVQDLTGTERAAVLQETHLKKGPQDLPLPVQRLQPGLYLVVVQSEEGQEHIRLQVY